MKIWDPFIINDHGMVHKNSNGEMHYLVVKIMTSFKLLSSTCMIMCYFCHPHLYGHTVFMKWSITKSNINNKNDINGTMILRNYNDSLLSLFRNKLIDKTIYR